MMIQKMGLSGSKYSLNLSSEGCFEPVLYQLLSPTAKQCQKGLKTQNLRAKQLKATVKSN